MELTKEERDFLIRVLSSANVNPTDPNAIETVKMIQSILAKLKK